jgi:hypothetical protein
MGTFRIKSLSYPKCQEFCARFDELFTEWKTTPRTALFRERLPPKEDGLVMIPSYRASEIESLSPGGWSDLSDPSDREWVVLIGRAGAAKHFNLNTPTKTGMFD